MNFDLGIRPENLTIVTESNSDRSDILIAKIVAIEPLGKEILLRTKLQGANTALDLLTHQNWQGKVGDTINVSLDSNHLFIFDSHDGKTLYSPLY